MNSVLVAADLHIDAGRWGTTNPATGINSAWESATGVWHAICRQAVEDRVDALLFAGDAFANGTPTPEAQERFADGLRMVADAGIAVVCIPGNHEYLGLPASHRHPLWRCSDIAGVTISHQPEIVRLPSGLQVATLPWPRRADVIADDNLAGMDPSEIDAMVADRLIEALDGLADDIDPTAPSVLLAHATVGEATLGSDQRGSEITVAHLFSEPIIAADVLTEGPWGHVALGHIHRRQTMASCHGGGAVSYVGSPERIDWSEQDHVKGISRLVINTDSTITEQFVATPARVLHTVHATGTPPAHSDIPHGSLVRLIPTDDSTDTAAWRRHVADNGATVVTTLPVPRTVRANPTTTVAESVDPIDGLATWLASQDVDADTMAMVRTMAQSLADDPS